METVVVYDSKFGNTREVAEAIAETLARYGGVQLFGLDDLLPEKLRAIDLLVVGGPTQAHGMSDRMRRFLDRLEPASATGMSAATFDTRFRMPVVLSGSAARSIARRLERAGVHLFAPAESFFVSRGQAPRLEPGETERASAWAAKLATQFALSGWCAA